MNNHLHRFRQQRNFFIEKKEKPAFLRKGSNWMLDAGCWMLDTGCWDGRRGEAEVRGGGRAKAAKDRGTTGPNRTKPDRTGPEIAKIRGRRLYRSGGVNCCKSLAYIQNRTVFGPKTHIFLQQRRKDAKQRQNAET